MAPESTKDWLAEHWIGVLIYGIIGVFLVMLIISWWGGTWSPWGINWDKPASEMTLGELATVLTFAAIFGGWIAKSKEVKVELPSEIRRALTQPRKVQVELPPEIRAALLKREEK